MRLVGDLAQIEGELEIGIEDGVVVLECWMYDVLWMIENSFFESFGLKSCKSNWNFVFQIVMLLKFTIKLWFLGIYQSRLFNQLSLFFYFSLYCFSIA